MSKRFPTPKWAGVPARSNSKAYLEVWKDGEKLNDRISIGQQACYVFGRNTDVCDIELAHPSISRQHVAIVHTKTGTLDIIDLDSAQGTMVDNIALGKDGERKTLENGSEIVFGASTRKYIVYGLNQVQEKSIPSGPFDIAAMETLPMGFSTTNVKETQKNAERKAREEEIRKLTMEMMTQAPKVYHEPNVPMASTIEEDSNIPEPQVSSRTMKGPQRSTTHTESNSIDSDGPESDSDEEEDNDHDIAMRYNLPIKNHVVLSSHTKSISCIAVDAPGSRVATGSFDYYMKLWDFAGMARQVRPFRETEVEEGHPIVSMSYSPSGDRILVVTGSSQPSILTREGVKEIQFVKGDMYVMDMAHTKGHTHTCTGGKWNPIDKKSMATCSLDGTIRIWNLEGKTTFDKLLNDKVIKLKNKQGKRTEVTTCCYNKDGTLLFGGTIDGIIYGYDIREKINKQTLKINAHDGSDVSCIEFSNEKIFGTRSCFENTVKLWDIRNIKEPFKTLNNLTNHFSKDNIAFNSNGTSIAIGTSVEKNKNEHGNVYFYDVLTTLNKPIQTINLKKNESAICITWHSKINQIFIGTSLNNINVYYDNFISTKGVLLTATKKLPILSTGYVRIDENNNGGIVNPHALPMYRDENNRTTKRKYAKIRMDPIASKKPSMPITGPGFGGSTGGGTLTQYFMKDQIKSESIRSQDPREAILKYSTIAENDSVYLGNAYATTQPKDQLAKEYQLAKKTLEEEKILKEDETRRLLNL